MDKDRSRAKITATYVSAVAMFSLAAALVYFTFSLLQVTREIPGILQTVEEVNRQITPVVNEVSEIRMLVPPILEEVKATREAVPPLLAEVKATREWAKPVIREYSRTNEQIPAILAEIKSTREMLPPVLKTVDKAADAVRDISGEIEATRPLMPEILTEVRKTRESIPSMFDRADTLVANAREAGKEASRGAVTGVFSGLLMAPFVFVGDVGQRLLGVSGSEAEELSEEDYAMVEATTIALLNKGKPGEKKSWVNEKTGSSGYVRLLQIMEDFDADNECRELEIMVQSEGEVLKNVTVVLCQDDEGKWDFQ